MFIERVERFSETYMMSSLPRVDQLRNLVLRGPRQWQKLTLEAWC